MGDLQKIYYINAGKNGTFRPSGNGNLNTTAADVDSIIAHLRNNNQKKIVLYFHGGLVKAENGIETAERITRYVTTKTTIHPISFVWETGLFETIFQNFDTISDSKFFKKLLVKIIKVAGKKLGIDVKDFLGVGSKGVGSLTDQEIELELQKPAPFENYRVDEGKKSVSVILAENENLTPVAEAKLEEEVTVDIEEEIGDDKELMRLAEEEKPEKEAKLMGAEQGAAPPPHVQQKGIIIPIKLIIAAVKITVRVIKRHIKKRNHDFYPTIIEEILREYYVGDIGSWLWDSMKNKAHDMWNEDNFTGDPANWHAGSYLLKKLKEYQDEVGELTIDLVGHSAGSIVICELLNAVKERHPGISFRNMIYMAPAVRCDTFSKSILPNQGLFKGFRYFTMLDEVEKQDHLASFIYPRSLLYFISGLLENEENDAIIFGLQRHTIGNKPYTTEDLVPIIEYLKIQKRTIYSVTDSPGEDGFQSHSRKHGNFDNEGEITLDSIMYFINQ